MEYTAEITAPDYLDYHLFIASNSLLVKATRRKNRILVVVGFLFLAYVFYENDHQFWMYFFILSALLTTFLFPKYAQWYYRQRFKKHVDKNYQNNFGEIITIKFSDDQMRVTGQAGETQIDAIAIEEINEIRSAYFFKISTGDALIIPKAGLNDLQGFESELHELIDKFNIYHERHLNWAWK